MTTKKAIPGVPALLAAITILLGARSASADEAVVPVGQRFADPPRQDPAVASSSIADDSLIAREPELKRAPVRLQLGPMGITTGRGFGLGVGLGADFGTGSVGGRLSAAWLRGEGTRADGTIAPTGDAVGQYGGELTLDLHRRGPVHPVIGMGAALLHVSRPDTSGYAGVGTGRFALEYALGLEDADVRIGGSITGGLVGPVDSDVKDLRAYALVGAHLAIGF
jgi:hypothetical protein